MDKTESVRTLFSSYTLLLRLPSTDNAIANTRTPKHHQLTPLNAFPIHCIINLMAPYLLIRDASSSATDTRAMTADRAHIFPPFVIIGIIVLCIIVFGLVSFNYRCFFTKAKVVPRPLILPAMLAERKRNAASSPLIIHTKPTICQPHLTPHFTPVHDQFRGAPVGSIVKVNVRPMQVLVGGVKHWSMVQDILPIEGQISPPQEPAPISPEEKFMKEQFELNFCNPRDTNLSFHFGIPREKDIQKADERRVTVALAIRRSSQVVMTVNALFTGTPVQEAESAKEKAIDIIGWVLGRRTFVQVYGDVM